MPDPERSEHLDYLLTAYLFDSLSPAGVAEVERHLATCAECRQELVELKETLALANTALDSGGKDYRFDERRRKRVIEGMKAAQRRPLVLKIASGRSGWWWFKVSGAAMLGVGVLLALVIRPQYSSTAKSERMYEVEKGKSPSLLGRNNDIGDRVLSTEALRSQQITGSTANYYTNTVTAAVPTITLANGSLTGGSDLRYVAPSTPPTGATTFSGALPQGPLNVGETSVAVPPDVAASLAKLNSSNTGGTINFNDGTLSSSTEGRKDVAIAAKDDTIRRDEVAVKEAEKQRAERNFDAYKILSLKESGKNKGGGASSEAASVAQASGKQDAIRETEKEGSNQTEFKEGFISNGARHYIAKKAPENAAGGKPADTFLLSINGDIDADSIVGNGREQAKKPTPGDKPEQARAAEERITALAADAKSDKLNEQLAEQNTSISEYTHRQKLLKDRVESEDVRERVAQLTQEVAEVDAAVKKIPSKTVVAEPQKNETAGLPLAFNMQPPAAVSPPKPSASPAGPEVAFGFDTTKGISRSMKGSVGPGLESFNGGVARGDEQPAVQFKDAGKVTRESLRDLDGVGELTGKLNVNAADNLGNALAHLSEEIDASTTKPSAQSGLSPTKERKTLSGYEDSSFAYQPRTTAPAVPLASPPNETVKPADMNGTLNLASNATFESKLTFGNGKTNADGAARAPSTATAQPFPFDTTKGISNSLKGSLDTGIEKSDGGVARGAALDNLTDNIGVSLSEKNGKAGASLGIVPKSELVAGSFGAEAPNLVLQGQITAGTYDWSFQGGAGVPATPKAEPGVAAHDSYSAFVDVSGNAQKRPPYQPPGNGPPPTKPYPPSLAQPPITRGSQPSPSVAFDSERIPDEARKAVSSYFRKEYKALGTLPEPQVPEKYSVEALKREDQGVEKAMKGGGAAGGFNYSGETAVRGGDLKLKLEASDAASPALGFEVKPTPSPSGGGMSNNDGFTGQIIVRGNTKTKEKVVQRQNELDPSKPGAEVSAAIDPAIESKYGPSTVAKEKQKLSVGGLAQVWEENAPVAGKKVLDDSIKVPPPKSEAEVDQKLGEQRMEGLALQADSAKQQLELRRDFRRQDLTTQTVETLKRELSLATDAPLAIEAPIEFDVAPQTNTPQKDDDLKQLMGRVNVLEAKNAKLERVENEEITRQKERAPEALGKATEFVLRQSRLDQKESRSQGLGVGGGGSGGGGRLGGSRGFNAKDARDLALPALGKTPMFGRLYSEESAEGKASNEKNAPLPFPGIVGGPQTAKNGVTNEVGAVINHSIDFFPQNPETISAPKMDYGSFHGLDPSLLLGDTRDLDTTNTVRQRVDGERIRSKLESGSTAGMPQSDFPGPRIDIGTAGTNDAHGGEPFAAPPAVAGFQLPPEEKAPAVYKEVPYQVDVTPQSTTTETKTLPDCTVTMIQHPVPSVYETRTRNVLVRPESTVSPSAGFRYQTFGNGPPVLMQGQNVGTLLPDRPQAGNNLGAEVEFSPPVYETQIKRVCVSPASCTTETVPSVYKDETYQVCIKPESVTKETLQDGRVVEHTSPAVYETRTRKVVVKPESSFRAGVDAVYKDVPCQVLVKPQTLNFNSPATEERYLRSYDFLKQENPKLAFAQFIRHPDFVHPLPLNDEGLGKDAYVEKYGIWPFIDCARDNLSTFGMDVDTASYTLARAALRSDKLPAPESIHTEEFLNYFKQDYKVEGTDAFGVFAEAAPSPFNDAATLDRETLVSLGAADTLPREILKIGIKSRDPRPNERKPCTLTLVIDTSGSMSQAASQGTTITRLQLIQQALAPVIAGLNPEDAVSIVGFNTQAELALPRTQASEKQRILDALDSLTAHGETNVEAGLLLGLRMADEAFATNAVNRIVLCSDGVANVGQQGPDEIVKLVKIFAARGIELSTVGVGLGKIGDPMLRKLADEGNGSCHYADTVDEAHKIFNEKLPPHLSILARDAKVQVEFNADTIKTYRLIGYEKRKIKDTDFRNDAVTAGEVAHSTLVTVLYEIVRNPGRHGRLGKVYLRWKDAGSPRLDVVERNFPLEEGIVVSDVAKASPELRFLACVGRFAELLRHSRWTRQGSYAEVLTALETLPAAFKAKTEWTEVQELVTRAQRLSCAQWRENLK